MKKGTGLVLSLLILTLFIGVVFAFADGNGSAANPYQIASWSDLNAVRSSLSSAYVLIADLNSSTAGYSTVAACSANNNAGWSMIAPSSYFTGTLNGNNHTIADLCIYRPAVK